jgi:NarL family two-component system response regulator YdfI
MGQSIGVLIADDHEVVREGMRLILEAEPGFDVVGEARDGAEAVALVAERMPDVVLMDLRMPHMDGLEALEKIRSTWPDVAVVILTTYDEDDLMLRGLRAGARGYLLKDTSRGTLFNALRAAARGETLLMPEVVKRVLAEPTARQSQQSRRVEKGISLTDRESEVLSAVASGETSKKIALNLGITERTVKAHLASIFNKLGVDSRAAAVAAAIQKGLLDIT